MLQASGSLWAQIDSVSDDCLALHENDVIMPDPIDDALVVQLFGSIRYN